jgi:hypothetical protein
MASSDPKGRDILAQIEGAAFASPCAFETHAPTIIRTAEAEQATTIFGSVRTSSAHWDGGGGRTDIHDVWSALWAAALRANGVVSSRLLHEEGFVGAPEIYERYLLFDQPFGSVLPKENADPIIRRIKAHTSLIHHLVQDLTEMDQNEEPYWDHSAPPDWLPAVRRVAGGGTDYEIWITRRNPNWRYYRNKTGSTSVVEFTGANAEMLPWLFLGYSATSVERKARYAVSAGSLFNSVPVQLVKKGVQLIRAVEGAAAPAWIGMDGVSPGNGIMVIPLETHCAVVGRRTLALLRGKCGYGEYLAAAEDWRRHSETEATVFNRLGRLAWAAKPNADRFEQLAKELLERETGVAWVRSAGGVTEGDQGRDLLANWLAPPGEGLCLSSEEGEQPVRRRRIVIQVKVRKKAVGKADVSDVRDCVDWCGSEGYCLIAYPHITEPLVRYLESLAEHGLWVNWWGRPEIEERLRRWPDLIASFGDLVRLE